MQGCAEIAGTHLKRPIFFACHLPVSSKEFFLFIGLCFLFVSDLTPVVGELISPSTNQPTNQSIN
jgi:hypothetical protein